MQLADIVTQVQAELAKGSSISDDTVKNYIRDALGFIETEHDFQYMHQITSGTIDKDGADPRKITIPSLMKKPDALRLTRSDGSFFYLNDVEFEDISSYEGDEPKGYYMEGMDSIWLDAVPTENFPYDFAYWGFTTWDSSDTFEPWIFKIGFSYIKFSTLVLMSGYIRQPELKAMWQDNAAMLKVALLNTDENLKYGNKSMRMGFGHD